MKRQMLRIGEPKASFVGQPNGCVMAQTPRRY